MLFFLYLCVASAMKVYLLLACLQDTLLCETVQHWTSSKLTAWIISVSFSANKEEVPDNEQEKGTEKEMMERISEDTETVPTVSMNAFCKLL